MKLFKKLKKDKGILTVEASIVLTIFVLFVLFLFSFIRIYRAQNLVSHATLQAADVIAMESYLRENARDEKSKDVVYLANRMTGSTTLSDKSFESLRSANVKQIAKERFTSAIASTTQEANTKLEQLGVKNGLSGVDFSMTKMDLSNNDVIVSVTYTLKLQFAPFGANEITVTKSAKAKTFGEILFEITTDVNDANMGTTSGGGNYKHGTSIEISAQPYYGYKFVKWDDGNTDNPRIVNVLDAHKYVAIFEVDSFAINTFSNNSSMGSVSGGGLYNYKSNATINATPNKGHSFVKWIITDKDGANPKVITSANHNINVDKLYNCTAYFKVNQYKISVKAEGCNAGVTVSQGKNSGTSISADYGSTVTLNAPQVLGYNFKGWKEQGGSIFNTTKITVSDRDVTYIAVYEIVPSIKIFNSSRDDNTAQMSAQTVPSEVKVVWNSSNSSSATINSDGYVVANGTGTTYITASFKYNGITYSSNSIQITTKPSIYCVRYQRRDGYSAAGNKLTMYAPFQVYKGYGKSVSNGYTNPSGYLFWYPDNPGPNIADASYTTPSSDYAILHTACTGVHIYTMDATLTEIRNAKQLPSGSAYVNIGLRKTLIDDIRKSRNIITGSPSTSGVNASNQIGYIINEAPFFIKSDHSNGKYDYYITSIN